jgi:transposase
MPNRVRVLTVPDADRVELERRARDLGAPARVAQRARIVLLAADGLTGQQIAERTGCTEPTVIKWRRLYAKDGLAGLADTPRPGGPRTVLTDEVVYKILAATLTPPPGSLQAQGVTHWSSRRLADWLRRARKIDVSHDSISRLWRTFCLQPHRTDGFTFCTDPQLDAKVRDVVGLYLHPPENAVVVSADEKPRHELNCLFAALNTAAGQAADACCPLPRHQEFLTFLKKIAAACPGRDLHVVCDNYSIHEHAEVRTWLARPENKRITLHFTPAGCSWINLVECFTCVKELVATIGAFIDHWNDHPRPFAWIKDADEILGGKQNAASR